MEKPLKPLLQGDLPQYQIPHDPETHTVCRTCLAAVPKTELVSKTGWLCRDCFKWKSTQYRITAIHKDTGELPASDHETRDFTHYVSMLEAAATAFRQDVDYLIRIAQDGNDAST